MLLCNDCEQCFRNWCRDHQNRREVRKALSLCISSVESKNSKLDATEDVCVKGSVDDNMDIPAVSPKIRNGMESGRSTFLDGAAEDDGEKEGAEPAHQLKKNSRVVDTRISMELLRLKVNV